MARNSDRVAALEHIARARQELHSAVDRLGGRPRANARGDETTPVRRQLVDAEGMATVAAENIAELIANPLPTTDTEEA